MSNVRFLKENVADYATIAGVLPLPLSGLPASNLQNDKRGSVLRVSGGTLALDFNFDRPRRIGLIVIGRHNFSSAATWKREVWAGLNRTGTKVIDQDYSLVEAPVALGSFVLGDGPLGRNRYTDWSTTYAVQWTTTQPWGRSMRLTISDPDNPAGYLQAARLLFGEYVEPLVNMSWEHKHKWEDESTQTRTEGHSLRSDRVDSHRKISLSLGWNKDIEAIVLNELARINGKKKDIFISLYPGDANTLKERDYQMITKMPDLPDLSPTFMDNFQAELTFVES